MRKKSRRSHFFRDHSLTLVLLSIFFLLACTQCLVGHRVLNNDLHDHALPPITLGEYLTTGFCWESLAENWESEFLEMGAFVWLTSFLYQRGSPESNDPDKPIESTEIKLHAHSPWPARRGGIIAAIYARSLSLAFLFLFLIAFSIHALAGTAEYNRQQLLHQQPAVSTLQFVGSSEFWFQSLQNWQSEFLGIAAMVLLAIWLRQVNSPESKPVNASHAAHGE